MYFEKSYGKEASEEFIKEFNLLFNALEEYVLVIDKEGIILKVNNSGLLMLEYNKYELCGENLSKIYVSKNMNQIQEYLKDILKGKISKCNMQLLTKSKALVNVEACVFIGKWNKLPVLYLICSNNDKRIK